MFGFHEKRKLRQVLYSKGSLVVLAALVALVGINTWDVFQKERETVQKRNERSRELSELQAREAALREELDRLESSRGVEEEIRNKFDVGRKGEELIVIVEPQKEQQAGAASQKENLWQRFLDWF